MRTIGIDPGKAGGIVCLGDDLDVYARRANGPTGYEVTGKAPPNPEQYLDALLAVRPGSMWMPQLVVVEQQQPMPKQGLSSTYRTGLGFGLWLGLLTTLGWPYRVARARDWRKTAGIPVGGGGDPKAATIRVVQARLPALDLTPGATRKPHDGLADAAGMALAARVWLRGGL